jgi:hypothetical protein
MHIKRDWTIHLDEENYLAMQGASFGKILANPDRLNSFRQAIADVEQVVQPVACWDYFPVEKVLHEKLVLAGGTRVGGGPVVQVIGGAAELIVAVCTVGPAVDRLIDVAQKERKMFRMMILHELGAWAVDQIRQEWCRLLEDELHANGLRASAPLSPGESAWPVQEQAVLFSLLDAEQIGVTLSDSMIMTPIKSLSLIMGMGPDPMGVEGASNCDFCSIKEWCNYRHKRVMA